MRIGELSERTGVSPDRLRAWERRYNLLRPRRSDGGTRLYASIDEARVRLMRRYLEQGLGAAQAAELVAAARLTIAGARGGGVPDGEAARARAGLRAALDRFQETEARAVLEPLFGRYAPLAVIRSVLLPYAAETGERWERGEADVSQEHFATTFVQSRLLDMARGWDRGLGPRALLACNSGEQHTLGLLAFGVALHVLGWRITYLGGDTPAGAIEFAAGAVAPDLIVVATTLPGVLTSEIDALARVARAHRMALGGPSASAALTAAVGATRLRADAVGAAIEAAGLTGST